MSIKTTTILSRAEAERRIKNIYAEHMLGLSSLSDKDLADLLDELRERYVSPFDNFIVQ